MHALISRCYAFFAARLGHCTKCMRQSLAAALAMWGGFVIVLTVWPGSSVQHFIGLTASALTALWLLHIAVYAFRALVDGHGGGRTSGTSTQIERGFDDVGRRQAIGTLMRAAGVGLVASVPALLLPSAAFAFCGQCTKNSDCGVGWVCRNTAPVNSGKVCNECVKA